MKQLFAIPYVLSLILLAAPATGGYASVINGGSLSYVDGATASGSFTANPGSNAVSMNATENAYYTFGATLPETLTLSEGTSVTLSFSFQQTQGSGGFRIGLFNNNNTPLPASSGSTFDSLASKGSGIFCSFTSSSATAVHDAGTNGNIFFGTGRTFGNSAIYSAIGSTLHTVSITYALDGNGNTNITVVKDGESLFTSAFTFTGVLSFNEIILMNDSNNATGKAIVFSDLKIQSIPEPSALASLGGAWVSLLLLKKKRLSAKL